MSDPLSLFAFVARTLKVKKKSPYLTSVLDILALFFFF